MAWFDDPISALGAAQNVFSIADIFTTLIISTILCYIAAKTYQNTHDGISYSKNFVQITLVFGVLVSMTMLIIGSNIARAFTLLGALSIVRFRNAVKETKDVGFVFFVMAVGMACGTRFYPMAILMTAFICLVYMVLVKTNYGAKKEKQSLLKLTYPSDENYKEGVLPILKRHLKSFSLINIESISSQVSELCFVIVYKKSTNDV